MVQQRLIDIDKFQSARGKAKWWVLGSTAVAIVSHVIIERTFVTYYRGTVQDSTPFLLWLILRLSLIASLFLGLLTIPRWYSWLGLAAVVYILLWVR